MHAGMVGRLTEELAVWRRKCIILESASEVQARAM